MDDPNIAGSGGSARVPIYALYGESDPPPISESLHCESIARRSRLHGWEIRPHRHDLFAQILLIRGGRTEARVEDRRQALVAPALLFVPALCVHGFRFSQDVDGIVVTIVARALDRLLASMAELLPRFGVPQSLCFEPGAAEFLAIERALDAVVHEFAGAAPGRLAAIEASLATALVQIGRRSAGPEDAGAVPTRGLLHVRGFRALVDRHFRDKREIGFYADRLAITPTQLNRVCRQVLGRSALGAINSRLIVEAKRDLAYTNLDVKSVAAGLGFADAAYFSRFFARHTGLAPTGFRQAAQAGLARGRAV